MSSNTPTRILTKTEYEKHPNEMDKVKHLEKVTKQIFSWNIIDLLKTNNEIITYFLKEKHEYGKGYGIITAGIADLAQFSTNPEDRFPKERHLLKDYTGTIEGLCQNIISLTYNKVELKEYFKNFETYKEWINLNYKRIKDTLNISIFLFLKKLFTLDESDNVFLLDKKNEKKWPILAEANKLISKLKQMKKIEYGNSNENQKSLDLFKSIISTYEQMIAEPSTKWHIKQPPSLKDFPISVDPSNMVLVASLHDKLEFEQDQLSGYYNPKFFDLPNIKTFWLDIPKGRAFLFDKRALQISPFFEGTYTTFFPKTLDVDIYNHFHVRLGLFELYPGVMFEKKSNPEPSSS